MWFKIKKQYSSCELPDIQFDSQEELIEELERKIQRDSHWADHYKNLYELMLAGCILKNITLESDKRWDEHINIKMEGQTVSDIRLSALRDILSKKMSMANAIKIINNTLK